MRGIDRSLVDEAWRELAAYPPGRVETEADAFIAQQPHVAAFAQTMTMGQDPAVRKAAFGLCFLLFKILERSLGRPFPTVADARLQAAYDETRCWLERADAAGPPGAVDRPGGPTHPTLVSHLLAVFYGDDGAPGDYDEGVRASLFLLLRTLTGALDLGAVEA